MSNQRPIYCCGKCPEIHENSGGGHDCTCLFTPECPNYSPRIAGMVSSAVLEARQEAAGWLAEICEVIRWSHVPYDEPEAVIAWIKMLQEQADQTALKDIEAEDAVYAGEATIHAASWVRPDYCPDCDPTPEPENGRTYLVISVPAELSAAMNDQVQITYTRAD